MPRLTPELAELICARLRSGEPISSICGRHPFPSVATLRNWRRADPHFGAQVAAAIAQAGRAYVAYGPELVELIVAEVARGTSLAALSRRPGFPHASTLNDWRRTRPGFAARLDEALARRPPRPLVTEDEAERVFEHMFAGLSVAEACALGGVSVSRLYRWRARDLAFRQRMAATLAMRPPSSRHRKGMAGYSPDRARAILSRLVAGEPLRALVRDPAMPCRTTIRNWARLDPAFDERLRAAMRAPRNPVPRFPRGWDKAAGRAVCERLVEGERLEDICAEPGMPAAGTVRRWARDYPVFRDSFRLAQQMQADWIAERAVTPGAHAQDRRRVAALHRVLRRG